jgi:hypothetical protein
MNESVLGLVLGGACALSCVACGSEDPSTESEVAQDEGADVLFEEPYSESGSITVTRGDDGNLAVGVSGGIGTDDPRAAVAAVSGKTLLETYAALHEDGHPAPDDLRELSAEFAEQRAAELAAMGHEEARLDPAAAAAQPKDANAFYANACQLIGGNFEGYWPQECPFMPNWHGICTFGNIGTNDLSIGWNETPYWSSHTLSNNSNVQRIPPWTFYVAAWGGVYANQYSCLFLDGSNTYGQVGVTWHDYFTDNVGNPI